tara:strand:+ start:1136 stop:1603 length:468 start_codon:yes stop_codon:yes gene_type:complete
MNRVYKLQGRSKPKRFLTNKKKIKRGRFSVTNTNIKRKVGSKPTNKNSIERLKRLKYLVSRYNTRHNNQEMFYNNSELKSLQKVYNKKLNNKTLRKRLYTPTNELARVSNHTRTQGIYNPVNFNLTKSKLRSKRLAKKGLAKKKKGKSSRRSTYV